MYCFGSICIRRLAVSAFLGVFPAGSHAQIVTTQTSLAAPQVVSKIKDFASFLASADGINSHVTFALSPDGERLLYITKAQAVFMVEKARTRRMLSLPSDARCRAAYWAPDGTQIVIVCGNHRLQRLYLWRVGASTLDTVETSNGMVGGVFRPYWLPDGRFLYVFASQQEVVQQTQPKSVPGLIQRTLRPEFMEVSHLPLSVNRCWPVAPYAEQMMCTDSIDIQQSREVMDPRQPPDSGRVPLWHADKAQNRFEVIMFDPVRKTRTVLVRSTEVVMHLTATQDGKRLAVVTTWTPVSPPGTNDYLGISSIDVIEIPVRGAAVHSPHLLVPSDSTAPRDMRVSHLARLRGRLNTTLVWNPQGTWLASPITVGSGGNKGSVGGIEDTLILINAKIMGSTVKVAIDGTIQTGDSTHAVSLYRSTGDGLPWLPVWLPDGNRVLMTVRGRLYMTDVTSLTGPSVTRIPAPPNQLVNSILHSSDTELLIATQNPWTGKVGYWWFDTGNRQWRLGAEAAQFVLRGQQVGRHGNTTTIVHVGSTVRTPLNIYRICLNGKSGVRRVWEPLTRDSVSRLLPAVEDTVFSYRVSPGVWGTGWLIRPAGTVFGKYPTIVTSYPGGDKVAMTRYVFSKRMLDVSGVDIYSAIDQGYAVLAVDIPMMKLGQYGRGPAVMFVEGMNAALEQGARMGLIDTTRLGVIGASFGGYMVNVLVTHTNWFKAAVSHAGRSNLVSSEATGSNMKRSQYSMQLSVLDDPERYVLNSPGLFLDRVMTPLLLIHGIADYDVESNQSEEIFRGLLNRKKAVRIIRYRYGGHGAGWEDGSARRYALEWFNRYLHP